MISSSTLAAVWARRFDKLAFGALLVSVVALPFFMNMWPYPEGSKTPYRGGLLAATVLLALGGFCGAVAKPGDGWGGNLLKLGRYPASVLLATAASIGLGLLAALDFSSLRLMPGFEGYTRGDVLDVVWHFCTDKYIPATVLSIWVLAFLPRQRASQESAWSRSRLALQAAVLLLFHAGLVSAFASHMPDESFQDFRDDLSSACLAMLLLIHLVRTPGRARTLLVVAALPAFYIVAVNAVALPLFRYGGSDAVRSFLVGHELVYSPEWKLHRAIMTVDAMEYRPCFPFGHHNRLANYCMMVAMLGAALAAWPDRSRRERIAWAALVGALLVLLLVTRVRGAWLSFALGALAGVALCYRPWGGWRHHAGAALVIGTLALGWFVLPLEQRARLAKAFVWSGSPEEMDGNILRRQHSIQTALRMFERHDVVGIGYGYHVYEALYPVFEPPREYLDPNPLERIQPHAHMNWAQVAAEEGRIGLIAFLIHHGLALMLTLRGFIRAHSGGTALQWPLLVFTSLLVMMYAYGLTNFSLRYNTGMLTYLAMTMAGVMGTMWWRRPGEPDPLNAS